MQRLVRKLEQRKIAAVCIEDKLFPKTNSFIKGGAQPMADMHEFCGKIKAGKDAQTDPDFSIIESMNEIKEVIEPDPDEQAAYERIYPVFEASYHALVPIYDRIAEL